MDVLALQSKISFLYIEFLQNDFTIPNGIYLRTRHGGLVNVAGLNSGLPGNITYIHTFCKYMTHSIR